MTTLTTMFGMLPLALGLGEGSELMQPLAIAVIGGLSLSMILTLIVIPGAYVMVNRGGMRIRAWLTGRRGEEEPAGGVRRRPEPEPALEPVARAREEPA